MVASGIRHSVEYGSSVAAYCLDFTCSDTGEPITSVLMGLEGPPRWSFMTEPDFYDETVNSIKCYGNKEHECVKKRLGDVKFLFGDRTKSLMMSRCSMGFEGMQSEIGFMEKCRTGTVISAEEMEQLKATKPQMRLIQSRWIGAYKSCGYCILGKKVRDQSPRHK